MNQYPMDFRSYDSMEGIAAIEPSAPSRRFQSWPQAKLILTQFIRAAGRRDDRAGRHLALPALHGAGDAVRAAVRHGLPFPARGGRCVAGIEFSSKAVLRLGVALLGARITAAQILGLGVMPIVTVVVGVATTIGRRLPGGARCSA